MGHAGAIVGGAEDTAAAKIEVFKECGIEVAATPSDMADALLRIWTPRRRPEAEQVQACPPRLHAKEWVMPWLLLGIRKRRREPLCMTGQARAELGAFALADPD